MGADKAHQKRLFMNKKPRQHQVGAQKGNAVRAGEKIQNFFQRVDVFLGNLHLQEQRFQLRRYASAGVPGPAGVVHHEQGQAISGISGIAPVSYTHLYPRRSRLNRG